MQELNSKFEDGLKEAEGETGDTFDYEFVSYKKQSSDTALSDMCGKVS